MCTSPKSFHTNSKASWSTRAKYVFELLILQGKKLKLDLQKAVAHPVNAISSQSADHLRDKVARLSNLLAGKTVTISDVSINATAHPQGKAFCLEYLAKKLVVSNVLALEAQTVKL